MDNGPGAFQVGHQDDLDILEGSHEEAGIHVVLKEIQ